MGARFTASLEHVTPELRVGMAQTKSEGCALVPARESDPSEAEANGDGSYSDNICIYFSNCISNNQSIFPKKLLHNVTILIVLMDFCIGSFTPIFNWIDCLLILKVGLIGTM